MYRLVKRNIELEQLNDKLILKNLDLMEENEQLHALLARHKIRAVTKNRFNAGRPKTTAVDE